MRPDVLERTTNEVLPKRIVPEIRHISETPEEPPLLWEVPAGLTSVATKGADDEVVVFLNILMHQKNAILRIDQ